MQTMSSKLIYLESLAGGVAACVRQTLQYIAYPVQVTP